ncbi:YkgJ family cysteine cluster protein [Natronobiforma cellulositropha]|uniref:YkgJ family cysteine cluster protein n=1 Tax=Natronobiforma cellulositropha TaxID=1679076 RepID=UPI0021D5A9F7|nr:YkgJ family cysteine cluster protein [Natronobiforma cellulositropha]
MSTLEDDLARARELDVEELADAIDSIGFECTRCGACCTREDGDPHTATVFPDEVRTITGATGHEWRDVARPMPYGLAERADGTLEGETFEWALETDACGDCTFYEEHDGVGACTVHDTRPLICQTYPFSVALEGTSQPLGDAVDERGIVRAHECEGLGRDISREDARELARTLKERAVRELEEAIALGERYEPTPRPGEVVVHDSEGAKDGDGRPLEQ